MSDGNGDRQTARQSMGRRTLLRSALAASTLGGIAGVTSGQTAAETAVQSATIAPTAESELAITWERSFGGDDTDTVSDAIRTEDGGYLLVGATSSFGSGDTDAYAVRTDAQGNRVWDRTYGGQSADAAAAVVQTPAGGYLIAGRTQSYGTASQSVWLFETDTEGRMLWNDTLSASDRDAAVDVIHSSAGGYLLSYTSRIDDDEPTAARLSKVDADGTVDWDRRYGGNGAADALTSTIETSDGSYLSSGVRVDAGSGPTSAWLVKTAADGTKLWDRTLGGDQSDRAHSVLETSAGDYLLVGDSNPFGTQQVWLVETSSEGVVQWNSLLGTGSGVSALETDDGGYLVAGSASPAESGRPVYLLKTDDSGTRQWDTEVGSSQEQTPSALLSTDDGFTLAGTVEGDSGQGQQCWLAGLGPGSFPGAVGPPTSLDDDPLLEDIDGDGDGDIFDALTYYNERNSGLVRNNPRHYDFDGNGVSGTIFDTIELYNKLS